MTYDQLGDLVSKTEANSGTGTYIYDQAREQTSVTSPTGAQTQATYDDLGRLATTTDLIRQNTSAAYTTTYGYDAAGNLTSQTSPAGVTTTATYDLAGPAISAAELSATGAVLRSDSLRYNADGRITAQTDFNGKHDDRNT